MFCQIKSALGELEKLYARVGDVARGTSAQRMDDFFGRIKDLRQSVTDLHQSGLVTCAHNRQQFNQIRERVREIEERHEKIDARREAAKRKAKKKAKKKTKK